MCQPKSQQGKTPLPPVLEKEASRVLFYWLSPEEFALFPLLLFASRAPNA